MNLYGDRFVLNESCKDDIEISLPHNPLNIELINTVRHFELPARYIDNPGETHDEYELIYVEKGIFLDVSEDKPIVMHAGDAVVFSPGYFHSTVCDGEHSASVFITSFLCDSELMEETFGKSTRTHLKVTPDQRKAIASAFSAGVRAYKTNSHFCEIKPDPPYIDRQIYVNYLEILLLQIIAALREEKQREKVFFSHEDNRSEITTGILEYLKTKIYSNVTIDEVCRHLGYSRGHVCNHFKRDTGRTINNYYQSLKIEEAKRLILETDEDIGRIAETLNYSNPQYFNKVFHQFTGHTPGHFRKTIFKGSLEDE